MKYILKQKNINSIMVLQRIDYEHSLLFNFGIGAWKDHIVNYRMRLN